MKVNWLVNKHNIQTATSTGTSILYDWQNLCIVYSVAAKVIMRLLYDLKRSYLSSLFLEL